MALRLLLWALSWFVVCIQALPRSQHESRQAPAPPAWNSCGNLIRKATAPDNSYGVVNATDVYDCWATVPINSAVATRFLKYWNDTLAFQSSLEWLKSPPEGYQKPAADLVTGLEDIQNKVNTGAYESQYDFEADFQRLLYSANDDHVSLYAGVLSSFSFANPYGLTTLSVDGVAVPKVYSTEDLYLNQTKGPGENWQPSAITQIDGQDITTYLSGFASLNSGGTLEPHADWNTLMDNPVLDVLFQFTYFQGYTTFYPGDTFTFTFENGTTVTDYWLAIYNNPGDTGPLETGGDFYNFFVLGFYPASYIAPDTNATTTDTVSVPVATSFANYSLAYPDPNVYQANLTVTGFTTGYFFADASLAVLSIPTFDYEDEAIQEFSDAVQQFVDQAKTRGLQKVVIDLQENRGGDVILAYNAFKQFFPSITPYGGSNRRATPLANTLGSTITGYCSGLGPSDQDYLTCLEDEWNALATINAATGQNFTSWTQLYGPTSDGKDSVSVTQRLDFQDSTYDFANLGDVNPPSPLFQTAGASPWAATDIVILSDALCSSACALFLEFMRFDAGVRNVVVGGRPTEGPMQTPSLSRAARFYSVFELDIDITNAQAIDPSVIVPNRADQSVFINFGGISLRDQVGPNSEVPYQMQYQAADCRIYLTPNTFNNFTNLWHYAAAAMWTNPAYCVSGSTGHASGSSAPAQSIPAGVNYGPNGIVSAGTNNTANGIPLLTKPTNDAQSDLPLAVRPHRVPVTVEDPTHLSGNTYTYETTQTTPNPKSQCGFSSSDRASPQCSRKKKRSLENKTVKRSLLRRKMKR